MRIRHRLRGLRTPLLFPTASITAGVAPTPDFAAAPFKSAVNPAASSSAAAHSPSHATAHSPSLASAQPPSHATEHSPSLASAHPPSLAAAGLLQLV